MKTKEAKWVHVRFKTWIQVSLVEAWFIIHWSMFLTFSHWNEWGQGKNPKNYNNNKKGGGKGIVVRTVDLYKINQEKEEKGTLV